MPSLVVVLSDFHVGKRSDSYNMQKFERRLRSIPGKLKTHANIIARPDEIVLAFVGDLVDGSDIYPTQWAAQDADAPQQVILAREAISAMIVDLHRIYPKTPIRAVFVRGNHGRWSKTARPSNNLDVWLGKDIAAMAAERDDPLLSVDVAPGEFHAIRVGGTIGVLTHKSVQHIGTPATRLKFLSWLHRYKAAWLASGHYHSPSFETYNDMALILGGALCGPDDYGATMARFDGPTQVAFVVDGKRVCRFSILHFAR